MKRILVLVALVALVAGPVSAATSKPPAVKHRDADFGNILVRPDRQALYFWNVEKRDFKVHCTGSCAVAWPPLLVRSTSQVPVRVAGLKGRFGTIRRPGGKLQVTYNRLPLYTYAHERPNQVLCDDVGGWFVVRV